MRSFSISQRKKSRGNLTWYGRTFEDGTLVSEVSLKTTRKADAKAVQQLMRHESVDITLDTYSHLLQDDLKASVDVL